MPKPCVFISATLEDLRPHRVAVAETLRRMQVEPVMMEDFGSGSQAPLSVCREKVVRSDVWVGIYAWRYGAQPDPDRPSITETEYDVAGEHGKERLCYLGDERHPWPPAMIDGGDAAARLRDLKKRGSHEVLRSTFTTPEDLAAKVAADLGRRLQAMPSGARAQPALTDVGSAPAPVTLQPMLDDWMHEAGQPTLPGGRVGCREWYRVAGRRGPPGE